MNKFNVVSSINVIVPLSIYFNFVCALEPMSCLIHFSLK